MEETNHILTEANRCLNCKKPMCKIGCPIETNIPDFISKIKEEKYEEAYCILQEKNVMSEICSLICPVEKQCMGHCVRGIKEKPVQINMLENYVNNWAKENNIQYHKEYKNTSEKRVAVIGGGPAGIACAVDLIKEGINVTIFEKENKCGGILEYGIPKFRIKKDIISSLVDNIKRMGITIETNKELGKTFSIADLKSQGYDNIFLGMGAQNQINYKLSDEETNAIINSDKFLKMYNSNNIFKDLGITVVIGGGNVAFDTARVAIKSGAKEVYILYRRNEECMPARKLEIQEAIQEGVKIIYQTRPISAKIENKKITELECIKTEIKDNKAVDIEGSNYIMYADTVIFAIGAKANKNLLLNLGIKTENGLAVVDENYMTNIEGIYAGGDLVEAKSSVAKAIATGKKAASAIIKKGK